MQNPLERECEQKQEQSEAPQIKGTIEEIGEQQQRTTGDVRPDEEVREDKTEWENCVIC